MTGRLVNLSILGFSLALCGCATSNNAERRPSETRTVAAILARAGTAPVLFKDAAAAEELLSSLDQAAHLKVAFLLDASAAKFAEHTGFEDSSKSAAVLAAAQRRIAQGETDFEFREQNLMVAVVPIRTRGEVIGYVAVGSL